MVVESVWAAAGAMKLVAESFPWSEQSCFAYTLDNHNSVVGMREHALHSGAKAQAGNLLSSAAEGDNAFA